MHKKEEEQFREKFSKEIRCNRPGWRKKTIRKRLLSKFSKKGTSKGQGAKIKSKDWEKA